MAAHGLGYLGGADGSPGASPAVGQGEMTLDEATRAYLGHPQLRQRAMAQREGLYELVPTGLIPEAQARAGIRDKAIEALATVSARPYQPGARAGRHRIGWLATSATLR